MPPVPPDKLAALLTDRTTLFRRPPLPDLDLSGNAGAPVRVGPERLAQSWSVGLGTPAAAPQRQASPVPAVVRAVPPPAAAFTPPPAPVPARAFNIASPGGQRVPTFGPPSQRGLSVPDALTKRAAPSVARGDSFGAHKLGQTS